MGTSYHHGTFCQLQCLFSNFSRFLEVAFQAIYWPAHVNDQNMHLFISTFTSLCITCASDELFPIDNMTISVFSQKKKRQYLWTCNFSAKHLSHNPLCLRRKDYETRTKCAQVDFIVICRESSIFYNQGHGFMNHEAAFGAKRNLSIRAFQQYLLL